MAYKKSTVSTLKASSLVEVLIAMVIIVFSISLVMIMGLKITHSSKSSSQLQAELIAHNTLQQTLKEQAYFDTSLEDGLYTIERYIEKKNELLKVSISISTPSRSNLAQISQTVAYHEE